MNPITPNPFAATLAAMDAHETDKFTYSTPELKSPLQGYRIYQGHRTSTPGVAPQIPRILLFIPGPGTSGDYMLHCMDEFLSDPAIAEDTIVYVYEPGSSGAQTLRGYARELKVMMDFLAAFEPQEISVVAHSGGNLIFHEYQKDFGLDEKIENFAGIEYCNARGMAHTEPAHYEKPARRPDEQDPHEAANRRDKLMLARIASNYFSTDVWQKYGRDDPDEVDAYDLLYRMDVAALPLAVGVFYLTGDLSDQLLALKQERAERPLNILIHNATNDGERVMTPMQARDAASRLSGEGIPFDPVTPGRKDWETEEGRITYIQAESGHFPMIEDTEGLAQVLRDFVQGESLPAHTDW